MRQQSVDLQYESNHILLDYTLSHQGLIDTRGGRSRIIWITSYTLGTVFPHRQCFASFPHSIVQNMDSKGGVGIHCHS